MSIEKQVTIEEMNKVIALFMGARYWPKKRGLFVKYSDAYELFAGKISVAFGPKQLKYNSSWSWLMPVWKKIWYECASVGMEHDLEWNRIKGNNCARAILYGTITEAHKEIFEAIQWYNKQTP